MKILVIMPVYNQVDRIQYAIESILNQTYTDWHLVIVDDCSTDGTYEKLLKYSNEKITIVRNETNQGCYHSRNIGLQTAVEMNYEWDVHTIHDSDDVSSVDRFEKCVQCFTKNDIYLLTTRYGRTSESITTYKKDVKFYTTTLGVGIGFYHRELFDNLGYYDDTRFGGDSEYYERVLQYCNINGFAIGNFESEILYIAIQNSNNLTSRYDSEDRAEYTIKYHAEHESMFKLNGLYRGFQHVGDYKHIIVTRFNINIWNTDVTCDIEYTKHRLSLLQKFLIPSLEMQSNKNFDFYLLCEFGNDEVRDLVYDIESDAVHIYEWTGVDEFDSFIKNKYADYDNILTSRIDSDDYYLSNFIDEIQRHVVYPGQIIDCRYYLQYDMLDSTFITPKVLNYPSPFISVISKTNIYTSIYRSDHAKIISDQPGVYTDIITPLALQVIHGNNISNVIRG